MSNYPKNLKYTKEHEWARQEGDNYVVGVTFHAQDSLGDVVYVEVPEVGTELTRGQAFGVVESTKAVSELFAPLTGKVVKSNEALKDTPDVINSDPYGQGWLIEVAPTQPDELTEMMGASDYEKLVQEAS